MRSFFIIWRFPFPDAVGRYWVTWSKRRLLSAVVEWTKSVVGAWASHWSGRAGSNDWNWKFPKIETPQPIFPPKTHARTCLGHFTEMWRELRFFYLRNDVINWFAIFCSARVGDALSGWGRGMARAYVHPRRPGSNQQPTSKWSFPENGLFAHVAW
jgi:hypothetical protein